LLRRKVTSFWSSSAVHGPFFSPTLSQHGCLPIGELVVRNSSRK
jgi:hypothetical protein